MSNWSKLREKLRLNESSQPPAESKKRRRLDISESVARSRSRAEAASLEGSHREEEESEAASRPEKLSKKERAFRSNIVALDCEMVGIGLSGKQSALARCSIVSSFHVSHFP